MFECFSINSELDVPLNLGPNVLFKSFGNSHSKTNLLTPKEVEGIGTNSDARTPIRIERKGEDSFFCLGIKVVCNIFTL